MFRSSFLLFILITWIPFSTINARTIYRFERQVTSTRKPVSVKICGPALIRMLDMVCTKARQLLSKNTIPTISPSKRQLEIKDDPYSRTVLVMDYAQFNDTLVGDCCLQACTLKTLLKYC